MTPAHTADVPAVVTYESSAESRASKMVTTR